MTKQCCSDAITSAKDLLAAQFLTCVCCLTSDGYVSASLVALSPTWVGYMVSVELMPILVLLQFYWSISLEEKDRCGWLKQSLDTATGTQKLSCLVDAVLNFSKVVQNRWWFRSCPAHIRWVYLDPNISLNFLTLWICILNDLFTILFVLGCRRGIPISSVTLDSVVFTAIERGSVEVLSVGTVASCWSTRAVRKGRAKEAVDAAAGAMGAGAVVRKEPRVPFTLLQILRWFLRWTDWCIFIFVDRIPNWVVLMWKEHN